MTGKLRLLIVLTLLTIAGTALADGVEGSLQAARLAAEGIEAYEARDAVLAARSRSGGMELAIAGATGELQRSWAPVAAAYSPLMAGGPVQRHVVVERTESETVPLNRADITSLLARADSVVILSAAEATILPDGALVAQGAAPTTVQSHPSGASVGTQFYFGDYDVDAPHVNATIEHGTIALDGAFEIYVFNVDLRVTDASGERTYRSGFTTQQDGGAVKEERVEKIVLKIDSGRAQLRTLQPIEARSATALVALAGNAALADAKGAIKGRDAQWIATGDARLDGVAQLALAPASPGGGSLLASGDPALSIGVSGDATPIGFAVLSSPRPALAVSPGAVGAAAGGGLLVLTLVGAVAWRRRHPAPPPDGLLEEGVLRLEAGDVAGALSMFNAAAAKDPRNSTLHLDRAHCLERLGRLGEARRAYELAVRFAPENGEAHYHLARSLASTGLVPSAIAHLTRAFSLDPAFAAAAREDPAFEPLRDHPSYARLDQYYTRPA